MEPDARSVQESSVRPARPADLDGLLDLFESVAAEGRWIAAQLPIDRAERARRWRELFLDSDRGAMFVAESEDRLVGSANVSEAAPGLIDIGIVVAASSRRQGVGSKLLEACIQWSRDNHAHKITLEVWPHNQAAIALYERFGFVREGLLRRHYRRKNGELWDAIVMGLVLDDQEVRNQTLLS